MIRVSLINVNFLDDDDLFNEALKQVSYYRFNRVQRYHFRKDKNLSLGAGLALDYLLKQLKLAEKEMKYQEGKHGKLRFEDYPGIYFNISHSNDYAVCAIAPVEIGVDIEKTITYESDIAKQFCSEAEIDFIENQDREKKDYCFTRLWTLKESFLKNRGTGIIDKAFFPKFIPNNLPELQDKMYSNYHFREYYRDNYFISICVRNEKCRMEMCLEELLWPMEGTIL